MSRSWTPREQYHADKTYGFSSRKMEIVDHDGTKYVVRDPDSDISKKYKNLAFLLDEIDIQEMFDSNSDIYKELDEILLKAETILYEIINNDENNIPPSYFYNQQGVEEFLKTVALWYDGKLDKDFYYCGTNNEMFKHYMLNEAKQLSQELEK